MVEGRLRPSSSDVERLPADMTLHGPALRRYFSRRAPPDDVDDLVQDVFLNVHAARMTSPIADHGRYLFAVARHVLIDRRRRLARRCSILHDALEDAPPLSSDFSPERIMAARQACARALAAVDNLPPRSRAAFCYRRLDGTSHAAIADQMGISRESVEGLLQRARKQMCGPRAEYRSNLAGLNGACVRHGALA